MSADRQKTHNELAELPADIRAFVIQVALILDQSIPRPTPEQIKSQEGQPSKRLYPPGRLEALVDSQDTFSQGELEFVQMLLHLLNFSRQFSDD